jgi:hypothetical protein
MIFSFTKSSRCLVHFSITAWDGQYPREVDEDDCTPLIDEVWTPMDMTFLAMRSMRISSIDFFAALKSPDIHARD